MGLPGQIFRCSMPYSPYDPAGQVLQEIRHHEISVIVLLAETDKCLVMTGRDKPGLNRQMGFQVLHLPIPNGGVPLRNQREQTITSIIQHVQAGQHPVIHYYAGIGRTGLVAAAMAKRLLGCLAKPRWLGSAVISHEPSKRPCSDNSSWTMILCCETSTVFGDQVRQVVTNDGMCESRTIVGSEGP
jgi:hypothetical protein